MTKISYYSGVPGGIPGTQVREKKDLWSSNETPPLRKLFSHALDRIPYNFLLLSVGHCHVSHSLLPPCNISEKTHYKIFKILTVLVL